MCSRAKPLNLNLISRLRWVAAVFVICAINSTSLLGQPAAPQWLQELERKWSTAFDAGDATALAALYTRDAVILLPSQTARGRPAIDEFQKAYFADTRYACTWPIDGVHTLDRLVFVWGRSMCTATPRSGGPPRGQNGRWARVYELQGDGSWLIVRDSGQ